MSILFWVVSADFSGAGVRLRPAGAFPPCRPPPLPLALLFCPYPPVPLPGGKGETLGYFMQGASPLASPRLNPRGTGSTCRCRRLNGGRAPGVAGSASVSGARRGAFPPCRPPPLPLALPFAPIPLPPSQREGGDQGYFMQGASPLASPASDCLRHLQSLPYKCTCGRALSFSSANPALSFDSAPIPPAPFPGGEGGDFWLSYARGFAPCIPGLNSG